MKWFWTLFKKGFEEDTASKVKSPPKARQAICPGCSLSVNVDELSYICAVEEKWYAKCIENGWKSESGVMRTAILKRACKPPTVENYFEFHNKAFWACDRCIETGKAIPGDMEKQDSSIAIEPFLAYVDRPFQCEDCKDLTLFSAKEQRYWYEKLGFFVESQPKQCAHCRKKRRIEQSPKEIQDALRNLDEKDPEQLQQIAKVYEEMGFLKRAKEFYHRAQNQKEKEK